MSIRSRNFIVVGEFKPFGLIVEALDGKPLFESSVNQNYNYFLFNPKITREIDDSCDYDSSASSSCDQSYHELLIRRKSACWCRLGVNSESVMCVLQHDTLTIYNTSGEVVRVSLPHTVISIWLVLNGAILQNGTEGNQLPYVPFISARPKRDYGYNPQPHSNTRNSFDKGDVTKKSSHLIPKKLVGRTSGGALKPFRSVREADCILTAMQHNLNLGRALLLRRLW